MTPQRFDFIGQRPGIALLEPIPVTSLTGDELGVGLSGNELRKKADDLLRQFQKGPGLLNLDTGWTLKVNKTGRSKMGDNRSMQPPESKAVAALEDLVRLAVVAERHADLEHQNEFVLAILRLYAPLQIGTLTYRVKLTVKEYSQAAGTAQSVLHALSALEIENAPLGILPASTSIEPVLQRDQPTTGRVMSLRDLLRGVLLQSGKTFDFRQ
jgi:hypothetical protein